MARAHEHRSQCTSPLVQLVAVLHPRLESCSDLAYRGVLPGALGRFIKRAANESSSDMRGVPEPLDELFSSSRDLSTAAEDVERSLSNLFSAAGAGVNVLRLLFLGLRSIRAEYLKRISAWADATEAALDAGTFVPALPLPPPAAQPPDTRLLDWLASAAGLAFLRELRWLAPSMEVAVARLRGACRVPGYRPSDARLRNLLVAAGVPSTHQGQLTWVVDGLAYVARSLLSHTCNCPRILPAPILSCCAACRGVQMHAAVAVRPCPWCRQNSALHCQACGWALHYRGACAWNKGANRLFSPTADAPVVLCPDCHWAWMRARAALPWVQGPNTPSALDALVRNLRDRCAPGAGLHSSRVASTLRQRLRRHLRRWLSAQWQPISDALHNFRTLCLPNVMEEAHLRNELRAAVDNMVRSGFVLTSEVDGHTLVREA